jgi:hypothetical protein
VDDHHTVRPHEQCLPEHLTCRDSTIDSASTKQHLVSEYPLFRIQKQHDKMFTMTIQLLVNAARDLHHHRQGRRFVRKTGGIRIELDVPRFDGVSPHPDGWLFPMSLQQQQGDPCNKQESDFHDLTFLPDEQQSGRN